MNKLVQVKLLKNVKEMRKSTESCDQLLTALKDAEVVQSDPEIVAEFQKVIQHQKNMVKFFGLLEQQLIR